jgi:hypothetical protein
MVPAARVYAVVLQAKECAQAAQGFTEAAARELLALKKAEVLAAALLGTGKSLDPAAAEVLKGQAAVKCAEQLKVSCSTRQHSVSGRSSVRDDKLLHVSAAVVLVVHVCLCNFDTI